MSCLVWLSSGLWSTHSYVRHLSGAAVLGCSRKRVYELHSDRSGASAWVGRASQDTAREPSRTVDRQGDPQGQACCGKQARWGPVTKRGVLGVGVHSHNKAAEDRPGGCATIQVVAAGLCLYADYANGWVGSVGAQDGAWRPLERWPWSWVPLLLRHHVTEGQAPQQKHSAPPAGWAPVWPHRGEAQCSASSQPPSHP